MVPDGWPKGSYTGALGQLIPIVVPCWALGPKDSVRAKRELNFIFNQSVKNALIFPFNV